MSELKFWFRINPANSIELEWKITRYNTVQTIDVTDGYRLHFFAISRLKA